MSDALPQSLPPPRITAPLLAVMVVLTAMGIWPIWATDILPLVDQAAHLHLMTVMHGMRTNPLYQDHYTEVHALVPYLSYYKLVDWLGYLLPLELANRVILSLTVAAMPWSALVLLRATGRNLWLILGVLPWMLHADFFMGFFSYLLSIPVFLLILAAHIQWLRAPTMRHGLLLSGLVGVLAVTHYLLWAVAFVLLPSVALVFALRHGWRRVIWWPVRDVLMSLPSLGLLLPWFVRYFVLGEGVRTSDAAIQKVHGSLLQRLAAVYEGEHFGPMANIRQLPYTFFDAIYRQDELLPVLWFAALGLWLIGVSRTPRLPEELPERAPNRIAGGSYAAWAVAILVVEYFVAPRHLTKPIGLFGVNFRLVEVAMVLLICALPLQPLRPPKGVRLPVWVGTILMVVCAILLPTLTARQFRADRAMYGDIREAYAAIPEGQRVLTLRGQRPSHWFLFNIGEYYAIFRHGYVPYSFADTSSKPIVINRTTALPAPPIVDLEFFTWSQHGRFYDYIVRYDEPGIERPWQPNLPNIPKIFEGKGWTVWKNPSPDTWPEMTPDALTALAYDALPQAQQDVFTADVWSLAGLTFRVTDVNLVLAAGISVLPGPAHVPAFPWQFRFGWRWPGLPNPRMVDVQTQPVLPPAQP